MRSISLALAGHAQLRERHGLQTSPWDVLAAVLAGAGLVGCVIELVQGTLRPSQRITGRAIPVRGDGLEHLVERLLVLVTAHLRIVGAVWSNAPRRLRGHLAHQRLQRAPKCFL